MNSDGFNVAATCKKVENDKGGYILAVFPRTRWILFKNHNYYEDVETTSNEENEFYKCNQLKLSFRKVKSISNNIKLDYADKMIQTCISIHDLNALKLTPQQLHQLKWSWAKMRSIGATQNNVPISSSDQQLYFNTSAAAEPTQVGAFKF